MQSGESSNRIAYFDHLRVLAMFLIMMLHAASFCWYDISVRTGSWLILNAYKSLTDHAVLLFVMISGALFLGREVPIKKIYSKYVLRMVIAFIVWSLIYAIVSSYRWGLRAIFETTLASHYHLWFVPMIAGLYICLPILRKFVSSEKIIRYFLVVSFIFAFALPTVLNLISDFGTFQVSSYLGGLTLSDYARFINDRLDEAKIYMVVGYAFYFIAGYYLHNMELNKKQRYILYALGILSLVVTFAMTVLDTFHQGLPSDTYHYNFNIGVMFAAFAMFELFKNIIKGGDGWYSRLIGKLSKYSFGAYLIHALVIEVLAMLGFTAVTFSPVLAVPVIGIITFAVSFAVSALLNKIPFINKYIV